MNSKKTVFNGERRRRHAGWLIGACLLIGPIIGIGLYCLDCFLADSHPLEQLYRLREILCIGIIAGLLGALLVAITVVARLLAALLVASTVVVGRRRPGPEHLWMEAPHIAEKCGNPTALAARRSAGKTSGGKRAMGHARFFL